MKQLMPLLLFSTFFTHSADNHVTIRNNPDPEILITSSELRHRRPQRPALVVNEQTTHTDIQRGFIRRFVQKTFNYLGIYCYADNDSNSPYEPIQTYLPIPSESLHEIPTPSPAIPPSIAESSSGGNVQLPSQQAIPDTTRTQAGNFVNTNQSQASQTQRTPKFNLFAPRKARASLQTQLKFRTERAKQRFEAKNSAHQETLAILNSLQETIQNANLADFPESKRCLDEAKAAAERANENVKLAKKTLSNLKNKSDLVTYLTTPQSKPGSQEYIELMHIEHQIAKFLQETYAELFEGNEQHIQMIVDVTKKALEHAEEIALMKRSPEAYYEQKATEELQASEAIQKLLNLRQQRLLYKKKTAHSSESQIDDFQPLLERAHILHEAAEAALIKARQILVRHNLRSQTKSNKPSTSHAGCSSDNTEQHTTPELVYETDNKEIQQKRMEYFGAYHLWLNISNFMQTWEPFFEGPFWDTKYVDRSVLQEKCSGFLIKLQDIYKEKKRSLNIARGIIKNPSIPPSISETFNSPFSQAMTEFETDLEEFIHPILHGCAEPIPECIAEDMRRFGAHMYNFEWSSAKKELKSISEKLLKRATDLDTYKPAVKMSAPAALSKLLLRYITMKETIAYEIAKQAVGPFFDSKEKKTAIKGAASQQALCEAKTKTTVKFANWRKETKCTHNIRECSLLGNHSKLALSKIDLCASRIQAYEVTRQLPYFSTIKDVNRILGILKGTVGRICDLNLKAALEGKELADDKDLKPCLDILNILAALPTESHDIAAHWSKNMNEIDALLDSLSYSERQELRDIMGKLISFSKDRTHSHSDDDSGMNIFFIGPTATGKTRTAKKLLELLGYRFIKSTEDELKSAYSSTPSVNALLTKGEVSVLETNLLHQDAPSSLLPILFFDEFSDKALTPEQIKRLFDQHSRMYFPAIGVEVPGYISTILTSNHLDFICNDSATAARFGVVYFKEFSQEKKKNIILACFKKKIQNNVRLKDSYNESELDKYITDLVAFNPEWNIKELLGFSKDLIVFLENQQAISKGELYRLDPSKRTGPSETFEEFLLRKAQRNKLLNLAAEKKKKKTRRPSRSSSQANDSSDDGLEEDSTSGDSD